MATTRPHYASAALYVGDLHPDVTEPVLYGLFSSVGPVASIRVCRDASSRKSLGYAYVNYHSVGDAEQALDTLNFTSIKGIPCRLMWCHKDPTLRKTGEGNIFVKNLDKSLDNKALYDAFSLFGNILSCKVATDEQGKSLGHGFVHFESEEAAQLAIDRVNGVKIGEKEVFVGHFLKRAERVSTKEDKFTNLYVKGFPAAWNQKSDIVPEVTKLFEPFGKVTSLMVKQDKRGRYFAFVNFENGDDARKAIEGLHEKKIDDEGKIIDGSTEKETGNDTVAQTESTEEERMPTKVVDATSEAVVGEVEGRLYVQRAQSRAERESMLKERFASSSPLPDSASSDLMMRQQQQTIPQAAAMRSSNIYVKNLADTIDDAELRKVFEAYGTVMSAKVMTDGKEKSRGFGFVSFSSPNEAMQAIAAMHNKTLQGKPLYVGLAERRRDRDVRLRQRFSRGAPPASGGPPPPSMMMGPNAAAIGGPGMFSSYPQPQFMMSQRAAIPPPMGAMPLNATAAVAAAPYMTKGPAGATTTPLMMMVQPPYVQAVSGTNAINPAAAACMPNPMIWKMPAGGNSSSVALQQHDGTNGGPPPAQSYRMAVVSGGASRQQQQAQSSQQQQQQQAGGMDNRKQLLGERLFPLVAHHQPRLAAKITGMMLEMDVSDLLILIESEEHLTAKINEALAVLEQAGAINRQ